MMSIPLFDCHCDTATHARERGELLRQNSMQLDFERLAQYSPAGQVFAVCAVDDPEPVKFADSSISYFLKQIEENSDIVKLCLNFQDILSAENEGRIVALLSIEGAEQITDIDAAYSQGVRIIHMTWNHDNVLCGAAMGSGSGLTDAGKAFVLRAQELGIMLDMSHISERGFWDTLGISTRPVIAGHSNSKSICDVPRNLTDEQFTALARQGGGAGINLYPEFLGLGRDIDAVFAHIEHFMALGGEKAVFLGCDLDGIEQTPSGISGVQDIGKIYETLLRHNYSEQLAQDIFRNNILRVMERTL